MSREVRGASLWRSATVRFARERVTGVGRLAPMNPRRLGAPPADASGRQRTPADGAATIYEKSCGWRQIRFELLESSQRHGLNPYVLRFARFGEPIITGG